MLRRPQRSHRTATPCPFTTLSRASLYVEPVKGLRVIAGLSITDAKQSRTQGGATDGLDAIGVPAYTANVNVEWDLGFLPGVTLTGRLMQTGKQAVTLDNTLELPEWTRFDLGARYVVAAGETPITFRFNVDNVANKSYWRSEEHTSELQSLMRISYAVFCLKKKKKKQK